MGDFSKFRSDEFHFWQETGMEWCRNPCITEIMNIINFRQLPWDDYKRSLRFQSRQAMIRGFFSGISQYLKENEVKQVFSCKTPIYEKIKSPSKSINWEKIAMMVFHLSADGGHAEVVYLDGDLKPIGKEDIADIIRDRIDLLTHDPTFSMSELIYHWEEFKNYIEEKE